MTPLDTDVLVVGAGPTGLTAAIELARRQVRVRIVDAVRPRPYAESRAEGLHARTLEIFERQGVLPAMLDAGRVLAGFAFSVGRRPIGTLSAAGLDSPHAYSLLLPQSEIERLLIDHLAGLGVTVERPVEVLDVAEQPEPQPHVTAGLRTADGATTRVSARFVVAADGAHSTIRRQLGIAFPGAKLQGAYVMDGDAEFATTPPPDRGTFQLARGGFAVVGRRPDDSYRIALSLPARDERISRERPTLAELQLLLDDFPQLGVRLRSITWSSAFFISSRHVDRLRHGSIFLAGDAAHIHSPVGGQGMNTGIQDAVNLGWKLALAVADRGGETLLESYDAERMPIIRRLIASTTLSTKPMLWRNPVAVAARNALLRLLLPVPALQTALFDSFTGFGVRYPGTPLAAAGTARLRGGVRVGDPAPDAGSGWHRRWGADPRHQLLVFDGPRLDRDAALRWAADRSDLVRPLPITHDTTPGPTGALHRRYGATGGALYLVRPDGFVAARSSGGTAPLSRYTDGVLARATSGPRDAVGDVRP